MATEQSPRRTETLPDGTAITIRPITAADLARQQAFFDELSPQSRGSAFLMGMTTLSRAWLDRLIDPADSRDVALVVVHAQDGQEHQIGLGRYAYVSSEAGAELAVTVLDAWQHRGVGTLLLEELIAHAREHGIRRLFSIDRAENTAMRKLARHFGATVARDPEDATQAIATLDLEGDPSRPTTPDRVRELMQQIADLEHELGKLIQVQQAHIRYRLEGTKVKFERSVEEQHAKLKQGLARWLGQSSPASILSAPFIYGMIVPLSILDLALFVFQSICFRLYRIPRVPRRQFIVIDRQHLSYLNAMEKLNCIYCGYANGLLAYAREIAARTEQYWCPIKHARKVLDPHRRYARFADFGIADEYPEHVRALREELSGKAAASPPEP